MLKNEKFLDLSELIDIKLLQKFQDTFAKAMNVASITVDNTGPITRPSNFTEFCTKYTRCSELGQKKCIDCDIKWGKLAAERGEPVIYNCHTGLTDFAVPIIVDGKHIGSILGGQILTERPDEDKFKKIAQQLDIDEEKYLKALRKIKIIPRKNVEAAAQLLFIVANSISEIGHKNQKIFMKNKNDNFYRIMLKTLRATMDIDETKKRIVNIIGQALSADRCFIVDFDKNNDSFSPINYEFLLSNDIDQYKGIDINKEIPEFITMLKKGQQIIISNKEIQSNDKKRNFKMEKIVIEKYDVKSAFVFPILHMDKLLGALIVHYVYEDRQISDEQIEILNMIADQVAVSIHQTKLYKITQVQKEKEIVLRKIMEQKCKSTQTKLYKKNGFVTVAV